MSIDYLLYHTTLLETYIYIPNPSILRRIDAHFFSVADIQVVIHVDVGRLIHHRHHDNQPAVCLQSYHLIP